MLDQTIFFGWWLIPTPLKNMSSSVSWDDDIPFPINDGKNNPFHGSKPPTRSYGFSMVFLWFSHAFPMVMMGKS